MNVHVVPNDWQHHVEFGLDCWCVPEYVSPTKTRRTMGRAEAEAMLRCRETFVVVHRSQISGTNPHGDIPWQ